MPDSSRRRPPRRGHRAQPTTAHDQPAKGHGQSTKGQARKAPAPTGTLVVAFVPGVTPTKWSRIWGERMRRARLDLRPLDDADARAGLADASVDMALLRFAPEQLPLPDGPLSAIPLYDEQRVVVVAKDSAIAAFDEITLADLDGQPMLDGDDTGAIEVVATGAAIATMPQAVARIRSRRDVVARPITDAPVTRIALVWVTGRAGERGDDLIDAFIGIVRGRSANSSR